MSDWSDTGKALESVTTPKLVKIDKMLTAYQPPRNGIIVDLLRKCNL